MEIIKKEIYLTDDNIDSLKNLFFSTLTTYSPVNISIIIGKNEIISFEMAKSSLKNVIKVTINLLNIDYLTGEESKKEIKVFDKVYNIESLNMIGFKYDDTFYFFKFNLNGIININKHIECTDNNYDYIFGLTCFLGSDSQDDLDNYGIYICDNIQYIDSALAEFILEKIDYFGFDELFKEEEYYSLSLKYNKKEATKYLMSFLIYCLKHIKNSTKNYYHEKAISNMAYNMIIPF